MIIKVSAKKSVRRVLEPHAFSELAGPPGFPKLSPLEAGRRIVRLRSGLAWGGIHDRSSGTAKKVECLILEAFR